MQEIFLKVIKDRDGAGIDKESLQAVLHGWRFWKERKEDFVGWTLAECSSREV